MDGLVTSSEPALQSRVQQVASSLNPDQSPLLQVRPSDGKDEKREIRGWGAPNPIREGRVIKDLELGLSEGREKTGEG